MRLLSSVLIAALNFLVKILKLYFKNDIYKLSSLVFEIYKYTILTKDFYNKSIALTFLLPQSSEGNLH